MVAIAISWSSFGLGVLAVLVLIGAAILYLVYLPDDRDVFADRRPRRW